MASAEEKAKALNIKGTMTTLIVSAFGFVSALFWRDAIKALIQAIVPEGQGILYMFGVAVFVTIISVIAIYFVSTHLESFSVRGTVRKVVSKKETGKKKKKSKN